MDPLVQTALERLPWWVKWGPPATLAVVAFGSTALTAWASLDLELRRVRFAADAHWSEIARATFPVRGAFSIAWLMGIPISLLSAAHRHTEAPGVHLAVFLTGAGLAAMAALLLLRSWALRQLPGMPVSRASGTRRALTYVLLKWSSVPIAAAAGLAVGTSVELHDLVPAALLVPAAVWAVLGGGTTVARRLGLVADAPPELGRAVERLARARGIRLSRVLTVPLRQANAFALPIMRYVVFTETAATYLSSDELEAVAAHELTHLDEPRGVVITRAAEMVLLVLFLATAPLVGSLSLPALLLAAVGMVVVRLTLLPLKRRMESRADAGASEEDGHGRVHAQALEHLYRLNMTPAVSWRGGPHADLYDRMLASGVEPDFPRPAKPDTSPEGVRLWLLLPAALYMTVFGVLGPAARKISGTQEGSLPAMALVGTRAEDLAALAERAETAGDRQAAADLYLAASQLHPDNEEWQHAASLAIERDREQRDGPAEVGSVFSPVPTEAASAGE